MCGRSELFQRRLGGPVRVRLGPLKKLKSVLCRDRDCIREYILNLKKRDKQTLKTCNSERRAERSIKVITKVITLNGGSLGSWVDEDRS